MIDFHKKFRAARIAAKLSQEKVAIACGLTRVSVTLWETENDETRTEPTLANLLIFCEMAGVTPNDLISDEPYMEDIETNIIPFKARGNHVPLISYVQAGEFTETIDNFHPNDAEEWIERAVPGSNIYALKVIGESMTSPNGQLPSFLEGQILHVDPDLATVCGDFIIARVKGKSEANFKQLKYDGDTPYLKSLNPNFKPIFGEFAILGKVVAATTPV